MECRPGHEGGRRQVGQWELILMDGLQNNPRVTRRLRNHFKIGKRDT
jgi:hypothetical protein